MNLGNKTVVLTGASGGLGQAIAKQLAANGARLILIGRNESALDHLLDGLASDARHHCKLKIDLGSEAGINELTSFCNDLPEGIDVLVNNAGISEFALLEDSSSQSINKIFFVNLIAPVILTSNLLPLLRQKPETLIVNTGSVLGAIGNPGFTTYCASKSGLARFSEALRRELADSTVNVIHLNPRATATNMNSDTVNELNRSLGNNTDLPDQVAQVLVNKINKDDFGESSVGWPEKFFVKINALMPRLVDSAFVKNLPLIKQSAKSVKETSETATEGPV
ncbi:MAG: SDR family oxidoreductase [Opitutaceae bacterium]|nr:SDR family oxidoreductase [Opitutaceae bacterium]